MEIKILKSLAGLDFSYSAGQIVNIPDKQAKHWVDAGLAELVENPVENAALKIPENAVIKTKAPSRKARKAGK